MGAAGETREREDKSDLYLTLQLKELKEGWFGVEYETTQIMTTKTLVFLRRIMERIVRIS